MHILYHKKEKSLHSVYIIWFKGQYTRRFSRLFLLLYIIYVINIYKTLKEHLSQPEIIYHLFRLFCWDYSQLNIIHFESQTQLSVVQDTCSDFTGIFTKRGTQQSMHAYSVETSIESHTQGDYKDAVVHWCSSCTLIAVPLCQLKTQILLKLAPVFTIHHECTGSCSSDIQALIEA